MRSALAAILTSVCLGALSPAEASFTLWGSVEYFSTVMPRIGLYRVSSSHAGLRPGESAGGWQDATVSAGLIRAIKGEPLREHTFTFSIEAARVPRSLPSPGDSLIVFEGGKGGPIVFKSGQESCTGLHGEVAISSDFAVLCDARAIVRLIERTVARELPPLPNPECAGVLVEERVPRESEAYEAIRGTSGLVLLTVLAPRHRERLLAKAGTESGRSRVNAVRVLSECFEVDTTDFLREMLRDPERAEWWTGDSVYAARQAAYEALRRVGEAVDRPEGFLEGYRNPERRVPVLISLAWGRVGREDYVECYRENPDDPERAGITLDYPPEFLRAGIEASGKVQVLFDADGIARDVWMEGFHVPTPPPREVSSAILAAAGGWRFSPVTVGGVPQPATVVVSVHANRDSILEVHGDPRLYPAAGGVPDGAPRCLATPLPLDLRFTPYASFDLVLEVDRQGNIGRVTVPEKKSGLPLARIALAAAWTLKLKRRSDAEGECTVPYAISFTLPRFLAHQWTGPRAVLYPMDYSDD